MKLLLLVVAGLLLFGCSGSSQVVTAPVESPSAESSPSESTSSESPLSRDRPLPYPVVPPPEFVRAVESGTRTLTGEPGSTYWQQETDYVITARLDPDSLKLSGTAQITYRNNAPIALPQLFLELAQNLHAEGAARIEPAEVTGGVTLERVAVDGESLEPGFGGRGRYVVDGTRLAIVPNRPLDSGASTTLEIDWSFIIPQAGASGRMGYSGEDLFFLAYWYPQMLVFNDVVGWQVDEFLGRAEFYAGFGDYDLTVEAPEGWLVTSTGTLQNPDSVLAPDVVERLRQAEQSDSVVAIVTPEDFETATRTDSTGFLRWNFTSERVRDVAFSVTRASLWDAARTPVGDRDGDGETDYTRIDALYRSTAPRWAEAVRYGQHSITFLSEYTGLPYPYPHMSAVEGGGIIGGGMEYPMMTLIGDYNAAGDSALYYVTAHELAHMWIPMIVGTDERRYSWMDEGSTSFQENQARMDFFPGRNHNLPDQNAYLGFAQTGSEGELMRWSNFHYSGIAFGVASYSKPATLLVALRGVLGEEVFLESWQTYIDRWAYKHPYPWDFFNTIEDVSGRDLDWFWRSWYYETWTLDQAIADVTETEDGTRITIEDRGLVPMPVHLTLTRTDGTQETHEIPVDTWLTGRTSATITVPSTPALTRIEIDPERQFPDVDRENNVWEG